MTIRTGLLAAVLAVFGSAASAQINQKLNRDTPAPPDTTMPTTEPATQPVLPAGGPAPVRSLGTVVVTSDLDRAREQIAPSLGADIFTLSPQQLQSIPGGENATMQQELLRAPGVVQDSFGQEHIRGEHGNLTYRINGVLLPEPLSGFGQEVDTRLVCSTILITGSLPAEFGFHTAGIVDITTKSGETLDHNELSLYVGSYDALTPSLQLGGTVDKLDYFVTGSWNHSDLGIENSTQAAQPLHDYSDQDKLFMYLAYHLDDASRLSLLMNVSYANFQIPDTPSVAQAFSLANHPYADSAKVDENQNEQEEYAVLSYQSTVDNLTYQISAFSRYGQILFTPDTDRDLILQGVAGNVCNGTLTNGLQSDGSYILDDHHTIRAGMVADYTTETLNTNTTVFAVNPRTGSQDSDQPFSISDSSGNHAMESGIYAQDEWRLTPALTFNYGLRYDRFDANFDTEDQVSPRANLVYKIDEPTTTHLGYSRYFVTPPTQNVGTATIDKFLNTTNAPGNFLADAPRCERSNYYDMGISRQVCKEWQVNLDGFYKQADQLIDEGQFGAPVILSPFNYKEGTVYGAELSNNYKVGGFTAFNNFSWVKTLAHDIDTQQYLIDNAELNYIQKHNIPLDHQAQYTVSTGASYAWKYDRVYTDMLFGTGLRAGFANSHQLQSHYPINLGYEHIFPCSDKKVIKLRFDVINVFDEIYVLRNGSGIGVGAPQYGQRRAFMLGLTYCF